MGTHLLIFALALFTAALPAAAKTPPPGTGSANVPANILLMLDTSGSMGGTDNSTIQSRLYSPFSIAVDREGNVFVTEAWTHSVRKFDKSGLFLREWGGYGLGNGQLIRPEGVAVDPNGNVYVVDSGNNRIQKFDGSGRYVSQWGRGGYRNGEFQYPHSIAADSNGNIYVVEPNSNRIQKFDSDGRFVKTWGGYGSGGGQFNRPYGIAADSNNHIYVGDQGNYRVQKFDSNGVYVTQWGTQGSGNGQFGDPWGIATDSNNNVYITEPRYNKIQKFNSSGVFMKTWGRPGTGRGEFSGSYGVAIDRNDGIYMIDNGNNRIQKFDSSGNYISSIGGPPRTRLQTMQEVIKKIVSDPDLTTGAYFGMMEWNSGARMIVNVSAGGAASIYTEVDGLRAGGGTNLDVAMNLANSYLNGSNSPINPSLGCQKTILVVLSDGEWLDRRASSIADNLYKSRGIQTHAIGFGSGVGNTGNYVRLSQAGGTYPVSPMYANNYQDLLERLSSAIRAAIDSRLTFTAPTLMPGIGEADALYQSSFDYKKDHQWQGHLIKYAIDASGNIGDKLWDAGAMLNTTGASKRKIWTVLSGLSIAGLDNFTDTNWNQLAPFLYEDAGYGYAPTEGQVSKLVQFVRGIDAYDEDADNNRTEERWKLGDIYHSEVAVVSPPRLQTSTRTEDRNTEAWYRSQKGYEAFKSARAGRRTLVYAGGNDGMLHAFEGSTGKEAWAFIPPPLLPALRGMESLRANSSNSIYGVDGSPAVKDVFYGGRWRTVLLCGLGYGGKGYFALDITDPDSPAHLFSFSHDSLNKEVSYWDADGHRTKYGYVVAGSIPEAFDYSALGEAWSKPVILPMPYNGGHRWVAAMGGGYGGGAKTGYGSAVYVLDLENGGQILKKITLADNPSSDIGNGVAPMLTAISADGTSTANYAGALLYFTDLQGKLWKINLTDAGTRYHAEQLFNAEATRSNDRWAYHALGSSMVMDPDGVARLHHYFGTGNQLDIQRIDNAIQNRVFGIKDKDFPATANTGGGHPFTANALQDVAPPYGASSCPNTNQRGWFGNLEYFREPSATGTQLGKHQRVMGKAAIYNRSAIFSLYQPQATSACSLGKARLLELDYRCGASLKTTVLGDGIPTGAVVHKGRVYVGVSGKGGTPPAGWARKDNVMVGNAAAGSVTGGTVKMESWREKR